MRLLIPLALLCSALGLAPTASAANIAFARSCYASSQQMALFGNGFTGGGRVFIGRDGRLLGSTSANPAGAFGVGIPAPTRSRGSRLHTFAAVDETNTAIRALTRVRVTALDVTVRPRSGSPSSRRRVGARGFIGGRTLYAHVRRGRRYKRDVRIGRLRGPCATVSARRRLLRRGSPTGTYRVQFDVHRRYRRSRPTRVVFRVTVFRTSRSRSASAAAASSGERWTRAESIGDPAAPAGPRPLP